MTPIEQARAVVAARYVQPYQVNAILAGEWDAGQLVRDELAKIEGSPA
ncbi:MAG: hypothetical protein ABW169_05755 [Sphingobium sp.]